MNTKCKLHRKFYVYLLVFDSGRTQLSDCTYYSLSGAKDAPREFISIARGLGYNCFKFPYFRIKSYDF